ncbi:MAG: methyltransferase domain-containing protein [Ilumatobacteraceae bacterium]
MTVAGLVALPRHPDYRRPQPFAGPDHPMRVLTRAVAFGEPWTDDDATRVGRTFDELAPSWSTDHVDPLKAAPLLDAIDRGGVPTDGRWVELGSGTGAGCRALDGRVREHVSLDLSFRMLAHAPDRSLRVQADSSQLPLTDDCADVVLMINMILFPREVDRILRPHGHVVWVNTLGDQTPIHLPPDDVATALPGAWSGVTAKAGTGFWTVLRRTADA